MLNTNRNVPTTADLERSERLRAVIETLIEANRRYPIIVEGKKDARALQRLGLEGEILTLHRGQGLYEFCEEIAEQYPKVIVLLDWDTRGEDLYKSVSKNLTGHWEEFSGFREIIKILCQKDVKDIEGIPKLLLRLEGNELPR